VILAPALFCLGLVTPQDKPQVSWVKLEDGVKGSWSAKAVYPTVSGDTALVKFFNDELKQACESRFYEAAYSLRRAPNGGNRDFTVRAILSVSSAKLASALVTVTKTGSPIELYPVTCWLNGKQPLRCVWGSLVKAGTSADSFASALVLPALNAVREKNGLPALTEFPAGLLDRFVITQLNVCWIVPPGVGAKDATQVKVPIAEVRTWAPADGPLGAPAEPTPGLIPMRATVSWPTREPVPFGSVLQVSLLRERDDPIPLAVQKFPVNDPPMEVATSFSGVKVDPDERLYLDVRIMNGTETLFRNRAAIRMPAEGWQTVHAIVLDRERNYEPVPAAALMSSGDICFTVLHTWT